MVKINKFDRKNPPLNGDIGGVKIGIKAYWRKIWTKYNTLTRQPRLEMEQR